MSLNRDDNRFDILRLLAAWLVLFSHCFPLGARPNSEPLASTLGIDTLGGVGVAIFFVLSGYLVTLSVERSPNLLEFARRRVLRIYPGLVAICLLCVLVLGPLLTMLPQAVYWHHGLTWSYLQTASAWIIQYPLPGVFTSNPLPMAVNGALWSLPYEISCYLALALLSLLPGPLRFKTPLAAVGLAVVLLVRPSEALRGPFDLFLGLDYYHGKLGLLFALGSVFAVLARALAPDAVARRRAAGHRAVPAARRMATAALCAGPGHAGPVAGALRALAAARCAAHGRLVVRRLPLWLSGAAGAGALQAA